MAKTKKKKLTNAQKNAYFARMTPANKRVSVAKDVLQWLRLGKLVATRGTYLETQDLEADTDNVTLGQVPCEACALGAIFACTAVKVPTIKLNPDKEAQVAYVENVEGYVDYKETGKVRFSFDGQTGMHRKLRGIFPKRQLNLIEAAFEGFYNPGTYPMVATNFNEGIEDPSKRLERIMRNIIANNGTFRP